LVTTLLSNRDCGSYTARPSVNTMFLGLKHLYYAQFCVIQVQCGLINYIVGFTFV